MTLFRKLVLGSVCLVVVAVAVTTAAAIAGQSGALREELVGRGRLITGQLKLSIQQAFESLNLLSVEGALQGVAGTADVVFCKIVRPDATVYLADNREYYGELVDASTLATEPTVVSDYVDPHSGRRGMLIVEPVDIGGNVWWVLLAMSSDSVNQATTTVLRNNLLLAGAIMIPTVVGALLLSRSVSRPIIELTKASQAVASGQLDYPLTVRATGEVNILAQSFGAMTARLRDSVSSLEQQLAVEQQQREQLHSLMANEQERRQELQRILDQIRDAADNLSAASSDILTATSEQAAGASEQSGAITQASSTIEEVRAIAEQTAQRAEGVATVAQRTAEVSQAGRQAVVDSAAGMEEVKQRVEEIARNIVALTDQAQTIGQIISTVGQIATQSNLLSLNAAVEAARAGEAGKGFAVVAAEVRRLAEQSRAATVQVKEILSQIQQGVDTAASATEGGVKGAEAGVQLVGGAGAAIHRLAESVDEAARESQQIAAAAGQQLAGMEQVAGAMENIQRLTAYSVAGARKAEGAAEKLNELARRLHELVALYRVSEDAGQSGSD